MTDPATQSAGTAFRTFLDTGRAAWAAGRREEAVRRWRMAVTGLPQVVAGYVNIAGARGGDAWVERAAAALAPGDPLVAKNLGVLAHERGAVSRARSCLRRSLVLAPELPATARTFAKLPSGGPEAVADELRWHLRATVCEPGAEPAWMAFLVRLQEIGDIAELARRAASIPIPHDRRSAGLLNLLGRVFAKAKLPVEGLEVATRLVALQPEKPFGHLLGAAFHRRLGDEAHAIRGARRAAILDPASFDATCSPATEYCHAREFDAAVRQFRRSLRIDSSRRPEVIENLAVSLLQGPERDKGERLLREFLVVRPELGRSYVTASSAAYLKPDLGAAARYGRFSLVVDPRSPDAHYNMSSVRRHQGRIEDARQRLAQAVERSGGRAKYRFAQAVLELGDGDAEEGVRLYDARWDMRKFPSYRKLGADPTLDLPVWQGDVRPDATLALWGEQGVGDEIWFAAFLDWAVPRVGKVVLEVTPHLVALMQRSFPKVSVLPRKEPETEAAMASADLQLPMGGLMHLFGAAFRPIPTGYLSTDPQRVLEMRQRYTGGDTGTRVIGLSWRSIKPTYMKSFEASLEHWGPIFALDDAIFLALQYGDLAKDVELVARHFGRQLIWDRRVDAYRDLDAFAAQVATADVVVSVGNSTVVMAHALDKPVHALVRATQEDWRYRGGHDLVRWLPTARCAWQPDGGDWTVPIVKVAGLLRQGTRAASAGRSS